MKTVTFHRGPRNRHDVLHVETDGCIVNIRPGLSDTDGHQVTSVEIIADDYCEEGGRWHVNDDPHQTRTKVRVIQLPGTQRPTKTTESPVGPDLATAARKSASAKLFDVARYIESHHTLTAFSSDRRKALAAVIEEARDTIELTENPLLAPLEHLRDMMVEAHETNIYAEGDEHEDDCSYCFAIEQANEAIKEARGES